MRRAFRENYPVSFTPRNWTTSLPAFRNFAAKRPRYSTLETKPAADLSPNFTNYILDWKLSAKLET